MRSETRNPSLLLQRYFHSGWAFLIPYLAAYLLYAWQKWSVNTAGSLQASDPINQNPDTWIPSLLSVYWAFHIIHAILASITLHHWWAARSTQSESALPNIRDTLLTRLPPLAPWLLLALIFWIPGIYLEWPSDPWEHLRRINEWHACETVVAHSAWTKSSYFLPYSLTGFTTGLAQLSWLHIYYTAICLLLSWQYYRLARSVGLGERGSFVFVLLNALTFGNNIFSFYRYYGLSSSIFAQLGAVALTRIVLEWAKGQGPRAKGDTLLNAAVPTTWRRLYAIAPLYAGRLAPCALLLVLVIFNHAQGLGIAGLGVLAVIAWRLVEWKRSMIGWLALASVLLSVATVLWFPRHPALDATYRPQGWLTAWYGFNLFSPTSPAFGRAYQILGAFGVFNFFLGFWLIIRRNHIVGWLTITPVFALSLPCFALPFVHILASSSSPHDSILIFHRLLFAVPVGLVLAASCSLVKFTSLLQRGPLRRNRLGDRLPLLISYILPGITLASVALTPDKSVYNRIWHSLEVPPIDLQLHDLISEVPPSISLSRGERQTLIFAGPQATQALETLYSNRVKTAFRSNYRFSLVKAVDVTSWLDYTFGEIALLSRSPDILISEDISSWLTMTLPKVNPIPKIALTAKGTIWIRLDTPGEILEITPSQTVSNHPGQPAHWFIGDPIKIDHGKHYQVSLAIRQFDGGTSHNFLAVAWYDQEGRPLYSNLPSPQGAGRPAGWSNGSYSYYGLLGQPASINWKYYSTTFGYGENAAIPSTAAYMRVGALLNVSAIPEVGLLLKDVFISELPAYTEVFFFLPPFSHSFSSESMAAHLSGHWDGQHVARERAGNREVRVILTKVEHP